MNIFILDTNPMMAAKHQCDKHVVKMIVESVQMLVNPFIMQKVELRSKTAKGTPYLVSHVNHPCSIWARKTYQNYRWLLEHAFWLCKEYELRYGKVHRCLDVINELHDRKAFIKFDGFFQTPFALAMPEQYKSDDPVEAYRKYYVHEKAKIAKWKNVKTPYWMEKV